MIAEVVDALVASYPDDRQMHHIDATFLPNRAQAISIIEQMRRVMFPGFFDERRVTTDNVRYHAGDLLSNIDEMLYEQIRQSLHYDETRRAQDSNKICEHCDDQAREITDEFLQHLPELRWLLGTDVQAAFDGDPAAQSTDEAVFCYPGIDAIFTHRVAHKL